jgi:hypothetical protein
MLQVFQTSNWIRKKNPRATVICTIYAEDKKRIYDNLPRDQAWLEVRNGAAVLAPFAKDPAKKYNMRWLRPLKWCLSAFTGTGTSTNETIDITGTIQ